MDGPKDISKGFLLKLTLVCASFAIMIDTAIYPAAYSIYDTFYMYPEVLINTIITGTSLMVIFGSLLCGILAQFVGKKTLLAWAYVVFTITTFGNVFIADYIYILLVMRLISGLATGFIAIAGAALIAEIFIDEKTRSRMMGFYTGVMSAFGIVLGLAAGLLAIENWHNVFYIYLIAVPILAGVIFCVPRTKPERKMEKVVYEDSPTGEPVKANWGAMIALIIATFVLNFVFGSYFTMNSIYIMEQGLGDAGTAGLVVSLISVGSLITCFTFGWIFMKMQRFTPVAFSLLLAAGYLALAFSMNLGVIYVTSVIMGMMYGLSFSYYLMVASIVVPPSKVSLSIGLVNAAVSFAFFLGPYSAPIYMQIFGVETYAAAFPYMAATLAGYMVVSFIIVLAYHRRKYGSFKITGPGVMESDQ